MNIIDLEADGKTQGPKSGGCGLDTETFEKDFRETRKMEDFLQTLSVAGR